MTSQKHLFELKSDVCYLNCAAYSPLLKVAMEAGVNGIHLKANPNQINPEEHFFGNVDRVRELFAQLINCTDSDRIAVIAAVSYGMAVVANNLHTLPGIKHKKHIVLLQEEFPNNVYAFERVCRQLGLGYKTIEKTNAEEDWNQHILGAITSETAMVIVPQVHWIYGIRFDLEIISQRCKEAGALFVIDGTQSVGALPFDLEKIKPDALICGGYKWLLGAYSLGLAYFGEFFDEGIPVEESWMNRTDSEKFSQLTRYERAYRPKAQRYNVGEFSHFIQMPMLETSLRQILDWGVENIQEYCKTITQKPLQALQEAGCHIVSEEYRVNHLLGIRQPEAINTQQLYENLIAQHIIVSLRGNTIRVSPHLYNDESDLWTLVEVINKTLRKS